MQVQAASLGKPLHPDKLMEQASSRKLKSVRDTSRGALIPNLMGLNIAASESVAQPAEAVQQVALAADTIGNTIRKLQPDTSAQAAVPELPRDGGVRGRHGTGVRVGGRGGMQPGDGSYDGQDGRYHHEGPPVRCTLETGPGGQCGFPN